MHDRECRRQKDEGVLCQDHCYFKTSGLKECPVKSGIVATGIAEAGQAENQQGPNDAEWKWYLRGLSEGHGQAIFELENFTGDNPNELIKAIKILKREP